MYKVQFTETALRQLKIFRKKDSLLVKRIERAITLLCQDPNHIGLKTHKVRTPKYGEHFSSRVTGDIRLFWNYHQGKLLIILAVEDHSAY